MLLSLHGTRLRRGESTADIQVDVYEGLECLMFSASERM